MIEILDSLLSIKSKPLLLKFSIRSAIIPILISVNALDVVTRPKFKWMTGCFEKVDLRDDVQWRDA